MLTNKEKYDRYRPKKFLGQNFLVDDNIARKIVSSLDIKPDDNVLEIGPGQGALSKHLINTKCNYIAVELDKGIYENLFEAYGEKIKLIHKDFLKLDFEKEVNPLIKGRSPLKIIGNIPYNITSEILFRIFERSDIISEAVLMMQKEVAHRLTAKPSKKDYGILAVQTKFYSSVKVLFNVPPTAFFPKPRVHSSIVKFVLSPAVSGVDTDLFKKIVRTSFGQRRKVMSNSLKSFFEEENINISSVKFDFTRRPESVTVSEFIELTKEISRLKVNS